MAPGLIEPDLDGVDPSLESDPELLFRGSFAVENQVAALVGDEADLVLARSLDNEPPSPSDAEDRLRHQRAKVTCTEDLGLRDVHIDGRALPVGRQWEVLGPQARLVLDQHPSEDCQQQSREERDNRRPPAEVAESIVRVFRHCLGDYCSRKGGVQVAGDGYLETRAWRSATVVEHPLRQLLGVSQDLEKALEIPESLALGQRAQEGSLLDQGFQLRPLRLESLNRGRQVFVRGAKTPVKPLSDRGNG